MLPYFDGDRRIHKIKEADLWLLVQAGVCVLELEGHPALGLIPSDVKATLAKVIDRWRKEIQWRAEIAGTAIRGS